MESFSGTVGCVRLGGIGYVKGRVALMVLLLVFWDLGWAFHFCPSLNATMELLPVW